MSNTSEEMGFRAKRTKVAKEFALDFFRLNKLSGDAQMNYELSQHAKDVLAERGIPVGWLERILNSPTRTNPDREDLELEHYLGSIEEHGNRVLRVVINKHASPVLVVTLYFDRTMKGKL